jgi:peptide/nickel transport system substrate-binding protein
MKETKQISRRAFLRMAAATAVGAAAAACQPKTVVVREEVPVTQIVEVEKEITKIVAGTPVVETVVETQVVEKVVTATPIPPTPTPEGDRQVPRENTLIIGFEGEAVPAPEIANGLAPGSRVNQGYHQCMMESLYYLNYQSGEAIPWLAAGPEKWNDDYTEVDIPIRTGVEWNDGEPFTANDVAFTINMLKENPTLNRGGTMQQWVKECYATDDFMVHFVLTSANPRFVFSHFTVWIWGATRIVPQHIWEGEDPLTFTNFDMEKGWPVWSGPYRLVKASPTEFVYDRRDDWWGAKIGFHDLPAPERVVFVEAGPDEKKAATLAANDVDGHPSLSIDTFLDLKEKNPLAIGWSEDEPHAWIDPCPGMLGFNCQLPPWDDPDMRWAIAYALDHQKIADAGSGGFGTPSQYNFPAYPALMSWLTENQDLLDQYDSTAYDPRKAKEIIESKGYTMGGSGFYEKGGERLTVDILVKAAATVMPALLVTMLNAVGIDAAPKGLAHAPYYDNRSRGDFEIETTHVACGSVVEPYGELDNLHSRWIKPVGELRSDNPWSWENAEYDELVDQIGGLPAGDPMEHELFRKALEIRLKELPIISLSQQKRIVPYTTKYWTNWPTEDNDYFHPPNWWMCFLIPIMKIKPA